MSVSYTWAITKLYTKNITEGGSTYSDVIKRVEGTLTAKESSTNTEKVHPYDLDLKNPADWSDFTAYGSLSESGVQAWVEARLTDPTIAEIKAFLNAQIEFTDEVGGTSAKGTGSGDDFSATFPWS